MPTTGTIQVTNLYTIGHGNRSLQELIEMLHEGGIKSLVDVRAYPQSRRNPQFSEASLRATTEKAEIQYHWAGRQFGGMRKPLADSPHSALTEGGLRAFANYMDTDDFKVATTQLLRLVRIGPLCILCAECLPQHCHRSLIADYLTLQGVLVTHLLAPGERMEHQLRAEFKECERNKLTNWRRIIVRIQGATTGA